MCGEGGACVVKGGMRGKGGRVWYARPPHRDMAGKCSAGTHPTGMHSCLFLFLIGASYLRLLVSKLINSIQLHNDSKTFHAEILPYCQSDLPTVSSLFAVSRSSL